MGREIRRVPLNWQHPRDESGDFRPMRDIDYETAAKAWWEAAVKWHAGSVSGEDIEHRASYEWFWDWAGNPPDKEFCRPEFLGPADAHQIYENVTEGTPCSPVFATREGMIEWMVQPIDRASEYNKSRQDWRCMQGMSRAQAETFARDTWAPSIIVDSKGVGPGFRKQ